MSEAGPQSPAPRLTLGRIMAVAVVVGLTAGALLGIEDTRYACKVYDWWQANCDAGLGSILSMASRAAAWYGAAGCALAALVGVGTWAVVRLHGYRCDTARVAGLCAGALLFMVLYMGVDQATASGISGIALFSSIGFGCATYAAGRWTGTTARLASVAAGLVAASFVGVCWTQWLVRVRSPKGSGLQGRLGQGLVVALAIVLGAGVYRLVRALLRRAGPEGRRRAAQGLAVVLVSAALLAAGSWAVAPPKPGLARSAEPSGRPNVVWLVMDTARADAFSCYGDPRRTSPCVDKLGAEGAVFERAYANSAWTLPSHAAMFTGLLSSRNGTTDEHGVLSDRHTTLAEVLAEAGYATFGCSSNLNVSARHNLTRGFQRFHLAPWGRGPEYALILEQVRRDLHLADDGAKAFNRVATRWIDEAHDARRPFFLFINYFEVHHHYGSSPGLARWLPPGVSVQDALRISQNEADYALGTVSPKRTDFGILRALYEGDLTYLDERIGELADHLRRLGILDDTLLIVTSDHGEELGEHGVIGHNYGLCNLLLHVPLIVRYPKRLAAGTRRPDIVELIDLFPTVLDAAGLAPDGREKPQGRSLLDAPRPATEQVAVAERDLPLDWLARLRRRSYSCDLLAQTRRFTCIQDIRFKYIWASDDTAELFDLAQDPLETRNVLARFPQEAARLRAALEARVGRLRPGLSAAALARAAHDTGGKP